MRKCFCKKEFLPNKKVEHKKAIFKKCTEKSIAHFCSSTKNQTMITRLNHVSIFVLNQDGAYEFYVNKLGFKVHTDAQWDRACVG